MWPAESFQGNRTPSYVPMVYLSKLQYSPGSVRSTISPTWNLTPIHGVREVTMKRGYEYNKWISRGPWVLL